ncbi:MAG: hypothetical protein DHS20C01_12670 [marine bacterium B5-7]|nr:MAG: hypothetical protein DHS20C01_12670 [marine bacterium B5-7]
MSLLGLLLVLAAACCHATWNFLVKKINGGPELIWLFSVLAMILYLPVAVFIGMRSDFSLGLREVMIMSVSTMLHLGYFLLLQKGYQTGDLSLVYPTARATGPLLSGFFAVVMLREDMTLQMLAGAVAIIVGVLFLSGGFKKRRSHVTASLAFGLGAGVLIGSYTVWDAYAVSAVLIPPVLLDFSSSIGRSIVLAPIGFKRWHQVRSHWRLHRIAVIFISILNPLAYILVLYALTFTPVIYVAPVRESSVLISVLMGSVLLNEPAIRQRFGWALLMVIGVAVLATG